METLVDCFEEGTEDQIDVVSWKDGGFGLSTTPIESLEEILTEYPFGIFVFTKDDKISFRNEDLVVPRDNVVFELGLWLGRWGRKNCVIVSERGSNLKLPSDLTGVIRAEFDNPRDTSQAARKDALRQVAAT